MAQQKQRELMAILIDGQNIFTYCFQSFHPSPICTFHRSRKTVRGLINNFVNFIHPYMNPFQVTDSCRDGWNVQKVQESVDVIIKNWLYGLSLMSKHSCCQSKKWLFELFHLCAVKSKILPWTYKLGQRIRVGMDEMYEVFHQAMYRFFRIDEMYNLVIDEIYKIVWIWISWNWLKFEYEYSRICVVSVVRAQTLF